MSDYKKEKVEELKKLLENRDDEGHLDTDDQEFIYFFQSSLQEMEERTVERAMWCQFCGDELSCFGCEGMPGRTMEENRKLLLASLSPSGEKEVVRWKNTFVKGHLENMEEASKLSELLFPVEEEKKYCECHCHYESPCEGFEAHCTHCLPKKEKRGR